VKGRWTIAALALAACLGAGAAAAQDAPVPATPEAGRRAYVSYCVRCHGLNLAVGSSAFFDLRTFPKDDKARFVESVTNGKRAMPAWKGIVKPEEIEAIWAYIGSVNGW
jgi:mono/diheme cytochrome c family protein